MENKLQPKTTPGMLKKQALHFNHFFVNPFNRISDVTMSFRHPYSIGDALTSINGASTRHMSYRIVQEILASGVASSVTFEASKASSSAATSVSSASSSSSVITIDTPIDPRISSSTYYLASSSTEVVGTQSALLRGSRFEFGRVRTAEGTPDFRIPRVVVPAFKTMKLHWDYDNPCPHCGAVYLHSSDLNRAGCCHNGEYLNVDSGFPILDPLPTPLEDYATTKVQHFSRLSNKYNSLFSIASTGVQNNNGGGYDQVFGDSCIKIHGRTYHFLSEAAGGRSTKALSYLTFGGNDSTLASAAESDPNVVTADGPTLAPTYIKNIFNMLTKDVENPFFEELQFIGKEIRNTLQSPGIKQSDCISKLNVQTSAFLVGSIQMPSSTQQLSVRYRLRGQWAFENGASELIEPLIYPLFFPFGTGGWGQRHQSENSIPFHSYLRCRILCPEAALEVWNTDNTRLLPANRFQLFARLKQYYLVDCISRSLDKTLRWQSANQAKMKGSDETVDDIADFDPDNPSGGKNVFLSDNVTGSPRHLKLLAHNGLHIVQAMGLPTVFITLTCNPKWPEIRERLFPSQTAFDREDITCQVFHAKVSAFMANLRLGKYFGGARVVYEMRVIEYQHRGLPHAHIVVRLDNHPDQEDVITWIDSHIQTTMPVIDMETYSDDHKLHAIIDQNMVHVCANAVNGCLNANGVCRRGYSNQLLRPETVISLEGYPVYKRIRHEDLNVVPYNPQISMDWNGHANVEFCGSAFSVLYLYKYLYKGNKKVKATVAELADSLEDKVEDESKDEIFMHLKGRVVCSMDAMWRILGFHNYPSPRPGVKVIKMKMPGQTKQLADDGKLCDYTVYFLRPPELAHLLFAEFYQSWDYSRTRPKKAQSFFIAHSIPFYIYKRSVVSTLIRISWVSILSGEIWYLRQLLLRFPANSHDALKHPFNTFQEACIAKGIVKQSQEALIAFSEMTPYCTPRELRFFFTLQAINGHSIMPIWNDNALRAAMYADHLHTDLCLGNPDLAEKLLLKDLKANFVHSGKDMQDYGLPDVQVDLESEIDMYRQKYKADVELEKLRQLHATCPNNRDQESLYQRLTRALDNDYTQIIFLQGQGGSGKSTFAKKMMAYARSKGKIALGCASTGLAAQVYGPGEFSTAHALFGIPVLDDADEDENQTSFLTSSIKEGSDRANLLAEAKLIVWDEFLSNHSQCYDVASKLTDGFHGKVLLCMGDCKQIAPVVKSDEPRDTIAASITTSDRYWRKFSVVTFHLNMRLQGLLAAQQSAPHDLTPAQQLQIDFAEMLLNLGHGTFGPHCQLVKHISMYENVVNIPIVQVLREVREVVEFVFPQGFRTPNVSKRAILACTNKEVDVWNTIIQNLNPNPPHDFFADNEVAEVDDINGLLQSVLTPAVLAKYDIPSVPPNQLTLKVGDICLIVRTIQGTGRVQLSTNTRVKIIEFKAKSIRVETLSDYPIVLNIPRIYFRYPLPYGPSFHILRKQYPFRLAYSMTINKSQGQEFERAVLDIRTPSFAHGFCYVGTSRVRDPAHVAFFTTAEEANIHNVVYPELLEALE